MTPAPAESQAAPGPRTTTISFVDDGIPLQSTRNFHTYLHRVGTASSDRPRTRFSRLWHKYVNVTVPQNACRDHFALERTVLGYIRTSQAFAVLGVTVAQFMRLNTDGDPDPRFGFFKVAIPLSIVCYCTAIVILFLGTIRFFRWQYTIATGRSLSSGWEFLMTVGLGLGVMLTLFILNLTISIERSG